MTASAYNKWYPFYLWFWANVMAAALWFIVSIASSTTSRMEPDMGFGFFLMVSLGLLCSLPAEAFCCVVYRLAILKLHAPIAIKAVVCMAAVTGLLITQLSLLGPGKFDGQNNPSHLALAGVYTISILLPGSFLKIYKKSEPVA